MKDLLDKLDALHAKNSAVITCGARLLHAGCDECLTPAVDEANKEIAIRARDAWDTVHRNWPAVRAYIAKLEQFEEDMRFAHAVVNHEHYSREAYHRLMGPCEYARIMKQVCYCKEHKGKAP